MTTVRFKFFLKDIAVKRLWRAWTRSYSLNNVVRRFKRERTIQDVLQCFRQVIFRPSRTFILSATAVCKGRDNSDSDQGIADSEIQLLQKDIDDVQDLMKFTVYCTTCSRRIVVDKKQNGVLYCVCKEAKPEKQSVDGWVPYMEADDVIIWRKEYKNCKGSYAYKVYGRYRDVSASDFAAVQIDGAYRRAWDGAVASLSVVQRGALGVPDQAVLHWEVLWPRLFANRDYVFLRRHKQFDLAGSQHAVDYASVHAKAKRKSMEGYDGGGEGDMMYVVVSRSCQHPDVPETRHVIRVTEYWSHMVVKSTHGVDKPGMEFVLTYYDEPAVGGLPGGVAAWASSRAAPDYLGKMRVAAIKYKQWANKHSQELPDFTPFEPDQVSNDLKNIQVNEEDMESSKLGPELNGSEKKEKGTQTDLSIPIETVEDSELDVTKLYKDHKRKIRKRENVDRDTEEEGREGGEKSTEEGEGPEEEKGGNEEAEGKGGDAEEIDVSDDGKKALEGEPCPAPERDNDTETQNGSWWRYLYPFYYFV